MKKSVLSLFIFASFMAFTNVLKPNAAHSGENWKLKDECVSSQGDVYKLKRDMNTGIKGGGQYEGKISKNGDFFKKFERIRTAKFRFWDLCR